MAALFPPLSVAELAQISTHGGQAVADMAASRQLSQKAVMRGLWYAQRLGTPAEQKMAEYAARAVARTGLNFVAQSAGGGLTSTVASQAAATSGLLTLVGVIVACAVAAALFYPFSVKARVDSGYYDDLVEPDPVFPQPVPPDKESWKKLTDEELRILLERQRQRERERERELERELERERKRQDDDDFERSEDPKDFDDEIHRTGH